MLSNKVSEIMTRDVLAAPVSANIAEVMAIMVEKDVGRVVIAENDVPVGIFTEHDVLTRVMNKKLDPKETRIKAVMTVPVKKVPLNTHIVDALGQMYKGGFRHLLVSGSDGNVVGMVSMRRILKLAVEVGRGLGETQTVGSIMSGRFITVDGQHSISDTIAVMAKRNATCVVVLDRKFPKGIFTERDILARVAVKKIDINNTPVREVMTADVVCMPDSTLIGEVLAKMIENGFRHMPIRAQTGKLAGLVSMRDVLKYARALDIDENVRKSWKEVQEFWESGDHYTPG
ncbi:MAG: CBS domain-containing protein [Deltaproteobacteria bacterium]|nr:CBS domain-containing protein [Deltaproteobacteria bacterium]